MLATTPAEADRLLVDLRNLIRDRAEFLRGQRPTASGSTEFGPWVVLVVDELAELQAIDADAPGRRHRQPAKAANKPSGRQERPTGPHRPPRLPGPTGPVLWRHHRRRHPVPDRPRCIDQQIRTQLTIRIMLRVASGEQVNVCLGQGYGSSISPKSIGRVTNVVGSGSSALPTPPNPSEAEPTGSPTPTSPPGSPPPRHLTPSHAAVFGATGTEPIEEVY